ncbi:hypothetical protein [Micromonospora polyrhachis]|uniref:Uncharacterized protein n=1 Tax=Micromonospora polyrhachis TaxID=1282883 RepID=A0A7W7SX82_9ACTN|nr:hypothetical protein [Micromonospora polyrhachis]MBB4962601.1 hypothetical protein [Micromonospora polyrhachis]
MSAIREEIEALRQRAELPRSQVGRASGAFHERTGGFGTRAVTSVSTAYDDLMRGC